MVNCISCNKDVRNDSEAAGYPCPNCGSFEVVRCGSCRKTAISYVCPECEFEGP